MFTPPLPPPPGSDDAHPRIVPDHSPKPPVDCPLEPGVSCALAKTVDLLRDEVVRLNHSVVMLESHASGKAVRTRDLALTMAGIGGFSASVLWAIQTIASF